MLTWRGLSRVVLVAFLFSVSAAIAEDAEPCDTETTAVVQAFIEHALSDAGAELRLQAASESGVLHLMESVWIPKCRLGQLSHNETQVQLLGDAEADDLVRNLGGLHLLAIVDVEYPSADVAEVDYVLLARILHGTVIDKSLGCGGYVYMSKNEEGWKFDAYRPGICT